MTHVSSFKPSESIMSDSAFNWTALSIRQCFGTSGILTVMSALVSLVRGNHTEVFTVLHSKTFMSFNAGTTA